MRASISLGRIAGIPIGLHYSWLLIATLITLSLASHFRATNPDWAVAVVWASAVVTALLFFVTRWGGAPVGVRQARSPRFWAGSARST